MLEAPESERRSSFRETGNRKGKEPTASTSTGTRLRSGARVPSGGEGEAPAPLPLCEITVPRTDRGQAAAGIRVYRVKDLPDEVRTDIDGIPVTTPERTLLDLAAIAVRRSCGRGAGRKVDSAPGVNGSARTRSVEGPGEVLPLPPVTLNDLERAVARAEREGLVCLTSLRARVEASAGRAGTRLLRRILDLEGGPAFTRSVAESVLLSYIRKAGLPAPRTNVRVGRWELDIYWPAARLAVEVDGFTHHGTRDGFERDRARDADLAAAGILVMRVTWRQLQKGPDPVIGTIARALGQAEARAGMVAPR